MQNFLKVSTRPFPYFEANTLGVIEAPIADLVNSLNIENVCGTRASCSGHPFFGIRTRQVPFVLFVSDTLWAMLVSKMLAEYIQLPDNPLNYYWTLRGEIVEDFGLSWCLSIQDGNHWLLSKAKLQKDFKTLQNDIDKLATEFQKRIVLSGIDVSQKDNNTQKYQKFEPSRLCDFSKGIGMLAFRTHIGSRG
jgi:hypothetical protein